MKRNLFLLLLFAVAFLPAMAQTPESLGSEPEALPKYRIRSTVVGVPTIRDRFLSPLVFTGLSIGRSVGTIRHFPKGIRQHSFYSTNGVLLNGANNAILTLVNLGFDYAYHHQLLEFADQKLKIYGGGGFSSLLNLKFHSGNVNNVFAHDLAASLAASGMAVYDFTLFNRDFVLTQQLSVPFISIISRPSYVWSLPYFIWEDEGKFSEAIQVASFGNFLRVQNKLSLDFGKARKRRGRVVQTNTWRLTYRWDYYQMNRPNQVKAASQMLMIGRVIRI